MLGNLFKGVAWCSTIALSTIGILTFVPDESWERFPAALAPTRAQLAEFGIAPIKYRTSANNAAVSVADDERSEPNGGVSNDEESEFANDSTSSRTRGARDLRSRIGRKYSDFEYEAREQDGRSSAFDVHSLQTPFAARESGRVKGASSEAPKERVLPEESRFAGTSTPVPDESAPLKDERDEGFARSSDFSADAAGPLADADPLVDGGSLSAPADAFSEFSGDLFNDADAPGTSYSTSIASTRNASETPDEAPFEPEAVYEQTISSTPQELQTSDLANAPASAAAPLSQDSPSVLAAQREFQYSLAANDVAPQPPQPSPDVQPTTAANGRMALIPETSAADQSATLENALAASENLTSNEQARDAFLSLNAIRADRNAVLTPDQTARLNKALDRLAYEVFYNPARAILEPPRQTRQGDTLRSIAQEYNVTPELVAAVNGVDQPIDAPLPVGTALKVVRGPVAAELSLSQKELLLKFNGLYAGRFAFGVPQQATALRGDFVVENKLDNPACDAIDANGAKISIPGGSPENPLGAGWIGLNGGYGLQGTNRPELIGTNVPESGGFVFSNREIAQLAVLLPLGASVSFVE